MGFNSNLPKSSTSNSSGSVSKENIDLGTNVVSLLLSGISAAVLGLTLGLRGWVDAKVDKQDQESYVAWRDVIDLHAAVVAGGIRSANRIVSIWQSTAGDNTGLYWQVAGLGGVGWIDIATDRAYWHSDPDFAPVRVESAFVKVPGSKDSEPLEKRVKSIPGRATANTA